MKRLFPATLLVVLSLTACSGSEWGTELTEETPVGTATMYYGDGVELETAQKVFDAMVAANYNFASDLPEQVDMVEGRLTLRLGNDNEESIADILEVGEDSGVISYMHGLAAHVSKATGTPIDIILCRKTLDDPFYHVKWEEGK